MNLACATEVFQNLQGSGHCEIIYTGVHAHRTRARAHTHTHTHTHTQTQARTSPPPIPWRATDSQSTAGFSELTLVKLAGAFIVQGAEGFLHLVSRLCGNAIFSFPHPPCWSYYTYLQKLPSSTFFSLPLFPHKWPLDLAQPMETFI